MIQKLSMKQIAIAPYRGPNGLTNSIYGLSENGTVYQYRHTQGGWVPLCMEAVPPPRRATSYHDYVDPDDYSMDDSIPF